LYEHEHESQRDTWRTGFSSCHTNRANDRNYFRVRNEQAYSEASTAAMNQESQSANPYKCPMISCASFINE